jgi:outer membrane receptor protein involved in Fe transport
MSEREGQSGYWLFDSRLAWSQDESMLYMEISNITDREYVEVMTPMPGRWFRAGLIYKLNF